MVKKTGNPDPEPSDKPNTILNNYLLSRPEMEEFRNQVYNVVAFENTENAKTLITQYISALNVYPFKITPNNIYGRDEIKARDRPFNIATLLNKDNITIDLGILEVLPEHNNALDFINTTCDLFLPFASGTITLDPIDVIGKKLRIYYVINISDGKVTINIEDSETGVIKNVSNMSVGTEMPFYNYLQIENNSYKPSEALNNINTAYIIVSRPDYSNTKPKAQVTGALRGVTGNIQIVDINLDLVALYNERVNLLSILKDGVIFK